MSEFEHGSEPIGIMFCLDCMSKHSRDIIHDLETIREQKQPLSQVEKVNYSSNIRDLEHHMEDTHRITKPGKERDLWDRHIDALRPIRKNILYYPDFHKETSMLLLHINKLKKIRKDIMERIHKAADQEQECETCQG